MLQETDSTLDDYRALYEVRAELRANLDLGVRCPCCNQFAKRYRRKLNSAMARTLIYIYNESKKNNSDWIHVIDFLRLKGYKNSHDWALLRYWDLLEAKDELREDNSDRNGYYRITLKGKDFVEGKLSVLSHIVVYNNHLESLSGNSVKIKDCLNNRFDYDELMWG